MNQTDKPVVLLVEADILARHPLAQYLRECGFRVLEAKDDVEAKAFLRASGLGIVIALIDVDLPDGAGFELATWVRKRYPSIGLTLAGSLTAVVERAGDICREGPAIDKPYDHRAVHDLIRRLIAARDRER